MSSNNQKVRDMGIDLSGFSDDDIRSLYNQSTAGVRRRGYDDSTDVTVDYTPSAEDAIKASQVVSSDWQGGKWDEVRSKIKSGHSEEDLIHKMRGAVNSEYMSRRDKKLAGMQSEIDANTNREFEAPAAAPKEEEKVVESDKLSGAKERVHAYEQMMRKPGEGSKYGVFGQETASTDTSAMKAMDDDYQAKQFSGEERNEVNPVENQETQFSAGVRAAESASRDDQNSATSYLQQYKKDLIKGNKFTK